MVNGCLPTPAYKEVGRDNHCRDVSMQCMLRDAAGAIGIGGTSADLGKPDPEVSREAGPRRYSVAGQAA
jgi:hypothetical protein